MDHENGHEMMKVYIYVDELHRATDLDVRRRLRSASLPSLIV